MSYIKVVTNRTFFFCKLCVKSFFLKFKLQKKIIKDKITGRVDIPWRIFEKSAKKIENEVPGPKHHFLVNFAEKGFNYMMYIVYTFVLCIVYAYNTFLVSSVCLVFQVKVYVNHFDLREILTSLSKFLSRVSKRN